jgi:hypothetical protein
MTAAELTDIFLKNIRRGLYPIRTRNIALSELLATERRIREEDLVRTDIIQTFLTHVKT